MEIIILKVSTGSSFLLILASIMIVCFGQRSACMVRNMAATDPEESPKPPTSSSEDVEISGQTNESRESGGAVHTVPETPRKADENSGDTQGETLARDGEICVSHSRVSVESGAGASRAARKSCDEQKPVENVKDAPADEQRVLDSCKMQEEDDERTKTLGQETGMKTCLFMYLTTSRSPGANQNWGSTAVLG